MWKFTNLIKIKSKGFLIDGFSIIKPQLIPHFEYNNYLNCKYTLSIVVIDNEIQKIKDKTKQINPKITLNGAKL